jgi:hypothetical protein
MSGYRIQELLGVTNGKERWGVIDRMRGSRAECEQVVKELQEKRPTARFRIRKIVRW